jgi:hypothetical protein
MRSIKALQTKDEDVQWLNLHCEIGRTMQRVIFSMVHYSVGNAGDCEKSSVAWARQRTIPT